MCNQLPHTDVGRSCILVSIGDKNIMFDCGMHMGFNDEVSPVVQPGLVQMLLIA